MEPNIILFLLVVGTLLLVPLIVLGGWLLRSREREGGGRRLVAWSAIVGVALAGLGVALVRGVSPSADAEVVTLALPAVLGELDLEERATGTEAMGQLSELHGQELEVVSTEAARYAGPQGAAQVWVGWAATEDDAHALAEAMTRAMLERETPFTRPVRQLDNTWGAAGMGQEHRYFASGTGVWWLAADEAVLGRTLADLLTLAGRPH